MTTLRNGRWDRRFHWVSSADGRTSDLQALEQRMSAFYAGPATRQRYQSMLDTPAHQQPATESALIDAVLARRPRRVLEVGCGSGRLYHQLRARGFAGTYTGVEMAADLVAQNRESHPDATWTCGLIEDELVPLGRHDVVFAYFVLEHCVAPERALQRMTSLADNPGAVLLVFPDFPEMGRFASQAIGRRQGLTRHHLARGAVVDALVGFYDARVRLPRALRQARQQYGPFPVNLNPRCLFDADLLEPDVDAVYIASAAEVAQWGRERGYAVSFPAGRDGHFRETVLLQLESAGGVS